MSVKTKRWNDPEKRDDGFRILVCRYRPRGVRKEDETWDAWCSDLAPSRELLADHHGKTGEPIPWDVFRQRYAQEMGQQTEYLDELAKMVVEGKTITLLCSSACVDESRCHRTLLRELIEDRLSETSSSAQVRSSPTSLQ